MMCQQDKQKKHHSIVKIAGLLTSGFTGRNLNQKLSQPKAQVRVNHAIL